MSHVFLEVYLWVVSWFFFLVHTNSATMDFVAMSPEHRCESVSRLYACDIHLDMDFLGHEYKHPQFYFAKYLYLYVLPVWVLTQFGKKKIKFSSFFAIFFLKFDWFSIYHLFQVLHLKKPTCQHCTYMMALRVPPRAPAVHSPLPCLL